MTEEAEAVQNPSQAIGPPENRPLAHQCQKRCTPAGDEKTKHTWLERSAFAIAVLAFIAAAFQGWVARDAETRSLRAYLIYPGDPAGQSAPSQMLEHPQQDQRLVGWVTLRNEGQTPAFNYKHSIGVKVAAFPQSQYFDYKPQAVRGLKIFGPHDINHTSQHSDGTLSKDDIDGIKIGQRAIYVYGTVEYTDIFKVQHWTNFCVYYQLSPIGTLCDHHNDSDDAPE